MMLRASSDTDAGWHAIYTEVGRVEIGAAVSPLSDFITLPHYINLEDAAQRQQPAASRRRYRGRSSRLTVGQCAKLGEAAAAQRRRPMIDSQAIGKRGGGGEKAQSCCRQAALAAHSDV